MPKAKEREQGFEESLSALEKIVSQLESGDLPLEKALELFETGVGLARRCQSQIEDAEQKVELLLRERGEIKVIPFEMTKENPGAEPDRSERPLSSSSPINPGGPGNGVVTVEKRERGADQQVEDPEDKEDDLDDRVPF
jgi:exodeoxyribonuclease VII small subunit